MSIDGKLTNCLQFVYYTLFVLVDGIKHKLFISRIGIHK